jgi:hypothetical protein
MSDAELEARFFAKPPAPPARRRPLPDWHYVHKELRRPGVTLLLLWLEYKEATPTMAMPTHSSACTTELGKGTSTSTSSCTSVSPASADDVQEQ